ncbi:cation diffusion facilitator family transporter [Pelistega suis]|uniref:cation diffusion facilitator family transporter n=1 Tax=Pelistega suis TaxID=1631957 RepID=UPI00211C3466|nr:cation diffusion facilitator family transporter [Pelistega suis]MCQ9329286.1 cation diffusion facilitator family transporter [Pelistega suis]
MACTQHCCGVTAKTERYRKVLWIAFTVNALMFMVEVIGGIRAGSVSLLSDSLDFLGDSANYLISLFVLGKAISMRAKASLFKAYTMGGFGVWIIGTTLYQFFYGTMPNYHEMGVIGIIAFAANVLVAVLLYSFREGDSNMRSVWLCSRNDAMGNLAVIAAAIAVYYWQSPIPDLLVALFMSYLAIKAAWDIRRQAVQELTE